MAAQDWTSGYPCKLCDMVCPDMSSLLDHIESHDQEDDRKYKCDECGRCYRHASSLTNHKKTHDVGSFECDICGKENSNASALKSHMRSHTSRKKHTCSQCGKAFRLASQLATHEKMHLTKEVRSYQNVNLESPTMEDGSHYENEESTSDVTVTKNSPAVKSELVNTPRSETSDDAGDRPYKCDLCDKSYIHLRSLANHKKTHQVGTFECEICFKTLSNMAALYSHQRSHKTRSRADQRSLNGSFTGPTCDQLSPPSPETSVHFCHLCQVVLTNEEDFQEHIQIHNSAEPCELEETMPDPLSSMVPYNHSVSSPDSGSYTPHLTNSNPSEELQHFDLPQEHTVVNGHHKPHCDNSESPSSQDSQVEANSVDSNRNNPTQSHDETQGASAGDDADRPFKCQICGKSYRHSGSLINHKRSHQTGIFNCPICRKSYPHLAALKGHLRLHKSQSPYFSGRTDWLSSEPLTQEHHQQSFSSQVDLKVGLADECASQDDNCEGEMHHEQFGQRYAEGPAEQPPDDNRHVQRHMCADCGETFADIAGIKSHRCPLMQQQDSNCSKYEGTVDFHQTNGHSVYENPQFGHQDDVDEQSYMLHDKMRKELMNESEDDADLYHCSLCGNNYTSMRALKTHLRGHTQSQENAGSSQPVLMGTQEEMKEDAVGEMMICSTCGGSFDNRQDLMTHQQQHHSQQVHNKTSVNVHRKPRRKKSQTVICGSCGILCTSLHQLKNHGCTRAGINKSVDVKQEVSVEDVVQHEVIRHMNYNAETGDRQYKCDQCGRSYRHAGSLLNHKKSHKTGIYRCLVCQKRFYNLLALKNHQRSHFDVKRYACTECGKAFKIQKQLLNHQRRHKENQAKIQELNSHIQTLKQMNQGSPVGGMSSVTQRTTQTVATMQRSMLQDSKDKTTVRIKSENAEDQRPFACDQCGRTYRHAGSLVNHKNSHKTGEYYCSICSNSYSNQLALKNHLRTHLAYKRHSCMKCGKCFRLRKQLASHVCRDPNTDGVPRRSSRSQGHRCKRCKQTFASAEQLSTHVCDDSSANANKDERIFTCNICNRSYRHAGSLLNHKNTHKTGHFGCSFCAKSFTNPMALRNHIRTHTQKKKYVCLTCGKAFRLASILHNHQKIHDRSDAYFSCSTCGKSFQGRSGLKRHRCHRGPLALHTESPNKCFTCDLCGRSYRHAGSLLNHKKTHSENLHHCALCLQTFPDAVTLQIHSQMRRHCCPECGKTFCLLSHMQSHMEGHSKDRSLVCSTCDRSFSNAGSYHQHLETHQHNAGDKGIWPSGAADEVSKQEPPMLSHLNGQQDGDAAGAEEKSHVCEHCGRTYRHAGSLLNHKNSHKTGSFFCSVCQKEFTNLMALKNHRRIHMEPKRYQCLDCGKAFRVSTQLICHRRIHTKEKPFACLLCDKSFSSKSNLRHHQKLHQNSQNYDSSFSVDANSYMDLDMGSFL
ncbi:zinc finger protein 646 [Synchiropus splendidus]|uniref:zinc finger protein 646 n=1 Tax=Synchiropus splendidus TaxID=270530 RepID=UPI00237E1349|nr:zinc finger protein 646 [Synchiropus splendidus]XP_053720909.1 zinc finger protein 646 [Synchiropus splendidus]XP_053720910.1 zinc finger protein 646 [Synchiropus splendidus]XP_053720911.1 zinc finger protein 646 [Synchiropus splendidus]XP_053720912.1 zinc finger protein 646 [Synchiropus splendidus]